MPVRGLVASGSDKGIKICCAYCPKNSFKTWAQAEAHERIKHPRKRRCV